MTNQEHSGTAALKVKPFRNFIAARFFLTMAIQMQAVAVGWQVYQLTKDPFALGIIGISEAIPFISLVLFAGYWADIYKRKQIILRSVTLFSLCAALLLFFAVKPNLLPQNNPQWIFYLVIGITGIARALAGPAVQSMLPQLFKRELYANGAAWNSTVWQIASVSGPAVGGLIYGFYGKEVTYTVCMILVVLSLFFFSRLPDFPASNSKREGIFISLKQGLNFVFKQKIVLSALTLDLFAVLFGGAVSMLPVFANDILHTGAEGLGILRAAPSIGAVITSIYITRHAPMRHSGKILLTFVALFGLSMIAFALSEIFWLSFVILLLSGAFDAVSVLIRSTIMQLFTPDEMRGRVSSVNSVFIGSSNELGAFESGLAAKTFGLVYSVIIGGCMTLGVVATALRFAPKLRKLHLEDHVS
ncbi:MAG TPA: MFS transporter [Flavobacteriales bacterium]|nr:MFS transporter [Flavobacteriales bacterium]